MIQCLYENNYCYLTRDKFQQLQQRLLTTIFQIEQILQFQRVLQQQARLLLLAAVGQH